jgi:hypothetical protein
MLSYTRFYEYTWAQYQLDRGYIRKVQETYANFVQDIDKIAADARNRARLLMENYSRELQAAALGDDTRERAGIALSTYQQEYAGLNEEYLTSIYKRYESLAQTLPSFQLEASQQALDNYIGLLQDVRKELTS